MENTGRNNQQNNNFSDKKKVVNENFEQAAGIKIHKGKENYGGGSGYYAATAKGCSPNANQECTDENKDQSRH
jgi:hypothetical protein